jgi:hypothetical protein
MEVLGLLEKELVVIQRLHHEPVQKLQNVLERIIY